MPDLVHLSAGVDLARLFRAQNYTGGVIDGQSARPSLLAVGVSTSLVGLFRVPAARRHPVGKRRQRRDGLHQAIHVQPVRV